MVARRIVVNHRQNPSEVDVRTMQTSSDRRLRQASVGCSGNNSRFWYIHAARRLKLRTPGTRITHQGQLTMRICTHNSLARILDVHWNENLIISWHAFYSSMNQGDTE